jgi:hypothetical protein
LQDALGRVKSLSGLLPICASCRRIRDKQNSWHKRPISGIIRKRTSRTESARTAGADSIPRRFADAASLTP